MEGFCGGGAVREPPWGGQEERQALGSPPCPGLLLPVLTALRRGSNPKSDVQSPLCRNSKCSWIISTPKVVAGGESRSI